MALFIYSNERHEDNILLAGLPLATPEDAPTGSRPKAYTQLRAFLGTPKSRLWCVKSATPAPLDQHPTAQFRGRLMVQSRHTPHPTWFI